VTGQDDAPVSDPSVGRTARRLRRLGVGVLVLIVAAGLVGWEIRDRSMTRAWRDDAAIGLKSIRQSIEFSGESHRHGWPVLDDGAPARLDLLVHDDHFDRDLALIRPTPGHGHRTVTIVPDADAWDVFGHFAFDVLTCHEGLDAAATHDLTVGFTIESPWEPGVRAVIRADGDVEWIDDTGAWIAEENRRRQSAGVPPIPTAWLPDL